MTDSELIFKGFPVETLPELKSKVQATWGHTHHESGERNDLATFKHDHQYGFLAILETVISSIGPDGTLNAGAVKTNLVNTPEFDLGIIDHTIGIVSEYWPDNLSIILRDLHTA